MNKLMKNAGVFLLVFALICALAACGQTSQPPTVTEVTETKEITVETPPPSRRRLQRPPPPSRPLR